MARERREEQRKLSARGVDEHGPARSGLVAAAVVDVAHLPSEGEGEGEHRGDKMAGFAPLGVQEAVRGRGTHKGSVGVARLPGRGRAREGIAELGPTTVAHAADKVPLD